MQLCLSCSAAVSICTFLLRSPRSIRCLRLRPRDDTWAIDPQQYPTFCRRTAIASLHFRSLAYLRSWFADENVCLLLVRSQLAVFLYTMQCHQVAGRPLFPEHWRSSTRSCSSQVNTNDEGSRSRLHRNLQIRTSTT